jgi:integrase
MDGCSRTSRATRSTPKSFSRAFERIVARAGVPRIRLHDVRHTHGTLLIKAGIPVKVVSERPGHGNPGFTTYQHVLPGMQAEAAKTFEALIASARQRPPGRRHGRSKP